MARVGLTPQQRIVLAAVARSALGPSLYWTGGTLLAVQYLHHRRSLDLDFFSEELPDGLAVAGFIAEVRTSTKAQSIRHQRFANRWQYFLEFSRGDLKLELVYFPFRALARRAVLLPYGIRADSLRDLAANKAHAAYERTEPRDAFVLYAILKRTSWSLARVLRDVERKFGVQIDLVHLMAKLHAGAERLRELRPLAVGHPPSVQQVQTFFREHAHRSLRSQLRP